MSAIAANLSDLLPQAAQSWSEVTQDWKQCLAPALAEGITPQFFVQPETEEEVAIALTHAYQHNLGVLLCGSGSKLAWGNPVRKADLVITTQRLSGLIENAAGDLTFTAQAGMTLAEAQAQLKPHNLFLPIDPSYPDQATLGGIIATADTGSYRHRYGGIRDMLLGIRFVRADGQIAKAGGRVVKNVAGYDLMKLFTGSYGTLGLLTEVTLRTYPKPETVSGIVLSGALSSLEQLAGAIARSNLSPLSVDWLLSSTQIRLSLRFGSIVDSVNEQLQEVQTLAAQLNLHCEMCEWGETHSAGQALTRGKPLAKFGLLPTAAATTLELIQQKLPAVDAILHAGSGLGRLYGSIGDSGSATPDDEAALNDGLQALRDRCMVHGGFLSLLDVPRAASPIERWGYGGGALDTMRRLKQQFDPEGSLNPGLFLVG